MAGTQVAAPTMATAAQMTAATVAGQTPTMTAAQGTVSAPMTAAQGTITSDATVKGQLESLQTEVQTALNTGNPLPVWARGAAKATEAAMANRGLSASSMAAEALAAAWSDNKKFCLAFIFCKLVCCLLDKLAISICRYACAFVIAAW